MQLHILRHAAEGELHGAWMSAGLAALAEGCKAVAELAGEVLPSPTPPERRRR